MAERKRYKCPVCGSGGAFMFMGTDAELRRLAAVWNVSKEEVLGSKGCPRCYSRYNPITDEVYFYGGTPDTSHVPLDGPSFIDIVNERLDNV